MTTEQMQYFIKLAETLNFTKAADQLFLTQPTLSRQIKRIEEELGCRLFIRSGTLVSLTEAGELFYSGIKRIVKEYSALTKSVETVNRKTKTFHIAMNEEELMNVSVLKAVNSLRTIYPDLDIVIERVSYHDLMNGLIDGKYDVANSLLLAPEKQLDPSLANVEVAKEDMYLAMSPDLCRSYTEDPGTDEIQEILKNERLLFANEEYYVSGNKYITGPGEHFKEEFLSINHYLPNITYAGTPLSVPSQVAAGLGVTICSQSSFYLVDPSIRTIKLNWAKPMIVVLLYNKNSRNPYTFEFLELLNKNLSV